MKESVKLIYEKYLFRSTMDIIDASRWYTMSYQIMFNFHPQRWTDNPVLWYKELILQNLKNVLKYGLNKVRD